MVVGAGLGVGEGVEVLGVHSHFRLIDFVSLDCRLPREARGRGSARTVGGVGRGAGGVGGGELGVDEPSPTAARSVLRVGRLNPDCGNPNS